MATKPMADAAPYSDFVREMRAALDHRTHACTAAEKRAIDGEMRDIMRRYLGPGAWEAIREAAAVSVPRGTRPKRFRPRVGTREYGDVEDRKLAAAGKDE